MKAIRLRSCRHAFTLIDLVIVIAVVAVLIGLLLTGISRAWLAAVRTQGANNVKQLALDSLTTEAATGGLASDLATVLACPITHMRYSISNYLSNRPATTLPASTTALWAECVTVLPSGQVIEAAEFYSPYRYAGYNLADTDAVNAYRVNCSQFRFAGQTNVAWLDGHVTAETMARQGIYHAASFNYGVWYVACHKHSLGWFAPHGLAYDGTEN